MEINIKGSSKEISELIKNISSAGDRQDVKKIGESVEKELKKMMNEVNRDLYQS